MVEIEEFETERQAVVDHPRDAEVAAVPCAGEDWNPGTWIGLGSVEVEVAAGDQPFRVVLHGEFRRSGPRATTVD